MPDLEENYHTLTITELLKGAALPKKKLLADYELDEEELDESLKSLPYDIPQKFISKKEARMLSREYSKLGCIMLLKTFNSNLNISEKPAVAPSEVKPDKQTEQKNSPKIKQVETIVKEKWPYIVGFLFIVILSISLLPSSENDVDLKSSPGQSLLKRNQQAWVDSIQNYKYSENIKKFLLKFNSKKSISSLITRVKKNKKLTIQENQQVSDNYVDIANDAFKHTIKLLKTSIAFNPNNKRAWLKLIGTYELLGKYKLARKTRREMLEYFPRRKPS